MSLEKIENSLKKCPDLPEIKILGVAALQYHRFYSLSLVTFLLQSPKVVLVLKLNLFENLHSLVLIFEQ
jgi:hypothetical protein